MLEPLSQLDVSPPGWRIDSLDNLTEAIKNGTTAPQNQSGIGLPITRIETISTGRVDYSRVAHVDSAESELAVYRLQTGDILLSHINSVKHIGKVARYDGTRPLWHGMNLMLVRLKSHEVDPRFGYYVLSSTTTKAFFERRCKKAINQASLSRADVGALPVLLPPLPEQRKIAAILCSVDDAIEKTQAVIEQVQVVKKGLIQELLTRGLPGRHTRFKQTEIGEVPEEWKVMRGESLFTLAGGYGPSSIAFGPDGECLFIKVDAFNDPRNRRWMVESDSRFRAADNPSIKTFGAGSLVFPKRGAAIFKSRVGLLCAATAVDPNLMVLTPNDKLDPTFFRYVLLHVGLFNLSDNSGVPQLNNKHLYPAPFATPDMNEQSEIADILSRVDDRLEREEDTRLGLEAIKTALMSVLLTGEVRVTPDADAA